MKNIIAKIKALVASHPRAMYELKSFCITFLGLYVALTGITETTTISAIVNNTELFFGSIGIAAFRTLVIFILKLASLDYRKSTASYK
jgi:uncharacterized membrane protein YozB (DUF420 family)